MRTLTMNEVQDVNGGLAGFGWAIAIELVKTAVGDALNCYSNAACTASAIAEGERQQREAPAGTYG